MTLLSFCSLIASCHFAKPQCCVYNKSFQIKSRNANAVPRPRGYVSPLFLHLYVIHSEMSFMLLLCKAPTVSTAVHVGGWDVHLLWSKDVVACASSKADTSTIYGLIAVELNELLTLFKLTCT